MVLVAVELNILYAYPYGFLRVTYFTKLVIWIFYHDIWKIIQFQGLHYLPYNLIFIFRTIQNANENFKITN